MSNDTFPESHKKTWKGVVHTLIPSRHKKYRAALIAYLQALPEAVGQHGSPATRHNWHQATGVPIQHD